MTPEEQARLREGVESLLAKVRAGASLDDDDVNRWTSTLDNQFSDGITVATVACGNNGLSSAQHKLNRVQVPSDGVNILGVGAADRPDERWGRGPYSAVGPGRSPGSVKPDFLAFGGRSEEGGVGKECVSTGKSG